MAHTYSNDGSSNPAHEKDAHTPGSAWFSILGLMVWLGAMILAVAGPLVGLAIPVALVVGMVVLSGIFSLLSLPRLFSDDKHEPHSHAR